MLIDRGTETSDQRRTVLEVLADLTRGLSSTSDWPNRLSWVAETLAEVLPGSRVAVGLMHDGEWMVIQAPDCASPDNANELHEACLALKAGVSVQTTTRGPGSSLSIPISRGGEVVGLLHARCDKPGGYTPEHEHLLTIVASQIGAHAANIQPQRPKAQKDRQVLEALMEHAVDGIAVGDSIDGRLFAMSRSGLELLGIEGFNPVGLTSKAIVDREIMWLPDASAPIRLQEFPLYRAAMLGEEVVNVEHLLRRPDGWEIPILSSAGPIRNAEGEITGGVLTFRDISDLKAARHELEAAYNHERHITDVLQQAVLPSVSADTPNYELAAGYHPALTESNVGGDFYDTFDVGEDWMALVMGDVSGRGLHAAVYTSMAKYMIRAYAHEDPEPKSVLRRLNETLSESITDDTFITVFYGLYDTARGVLAYANAGHEPPLLNSSSSAASTELDVTGPVIGMARKAIYTQSVIQLEPGNILVIYTDGITDSRNKNTFFGSEGLADVVARHAAGSTAEIAESIYQATMRHSDGQLNDDAALLLLRPKVISAPRPFSGSPTPSRKREGRL